MILEIILDKKNVRIVIKNNNEVVAETGWEGDLSLSEKLLLEIDRMLSEKGISKSEIKKVNAVYDDKSSVTSARIVQTVADAWNIASKACE